MSRKKRSPTTKREVLYFSGKVTVRAASTQGTRRDTQQDAFRINLLNVQSTKRVIVDALKTAFTKTNNSLKESLSSKVESAGTTATVTFSFFDTVDNKAYTVVANVGDSWASIHNDNKNKKNPIKKCDVFWSKKHDTKDEEEIKRVTAEGGRITQKRGHTKRINHTLNVTRTFGDTRVPGTAPVPDIDIVQIQKRYSLLTGSDGVLRSKIDPHYSLDEKEIVLQHSEMTKDNATLIYIDYPDTEKLKNKAILTIVCDGHGIHGREIAKFVAKKIEIKLSDTLKEICDTQGNPDAQLTNSANTRRPEQRSAGLFQQTTTLQPSIATSRNANITKQTSASSEAFTKVVSQMNLLHGPDISFFIDYSSRKDAHRGHIISAKAEISALILNDKKFLIRCKVHMKGKRAIEISRRLVNTIESKFLSAMHDINRHPPTEARSPEPHCQHTNIFNEALPSDEDFRLSCETDTQVPERVHIKNKGNPFLEIGCYGVANARAQNGIFLDLENYLAEQSEQNMLSMP